MGGGNSEYCMTYPGTSVMKKSDSYRFSTAKKSLDILAAKRSDSSHLTTKKDSDFDLGMSRVTLNLFSGGGAALAGRPFSFELKTLGKGRLLVRAALRFCIALG